MRGIGDRLNISSAVTRLARLKNLSWWMSILVGVACAAAGLMIRGVLSGFYANVTGFMILLPAVIIAALAAGRLAGLTATVACLSGGWLVVGFDTVGAGLADRLGVVATVNFVIVGLFLTAVSAALREMVGALDASLEALRSSHARIEDREHQLRLVSEHAPVMLWMSDENGHCIHLNAAQRAFWNAPEALAGFDFSALIHPDDVAKVMAVTAEAAARHAPFSTEARFRRQDGEWRVLHTDARPRMEVDGRYGGMIGVNTDVTEARAAEAEVRESEERFRAIADTAPVLIWVTQQDRTRAFVNKAYVAYNGGTYEHARLADWRAVIHPDDQVRVLQESLAGEASGQPFSLEARYLRHDGDYRWLKSFSRPRLGGDTGVIGFVGVAFDVTEIREAQSRLMESETRFRTVADSAPAMIWMLDPQGQPSFANRRYRTFFGVETEDQINESWHRLIHPGDAEPFADAFASAFARRDRFESLLRLQHPTLGERWLRCEGLARFDGSGTFQGYVGANIDVTEAKRAEEDLKRINELLEERVGEALAEKAKAEADLMHAQRMEAVGRLTGGVAHDFNNLLTVVIGALDIILRSPDDAAKRQKLGEAALAAARRGEGLTHQLLAFSRRQALRPEALDLNLQIRESEVLLRRAVGEAVEFKLKLRRGGARVSVDPSQFEAALLNLVVNARDAVGDNGQITIQTRSCTVAAGEVSELPGGDYVCVAVIDNGTGMSPELIARVFEPFFTTKSVGKGTGLGLSQVYGFARQSGGAARITSTVGCGTEVRLYLPPGAGNGGLAAAARPDAARPMAAGRRLLLVEDDVSVAAVALELLESLGLEVRAVETAPQALDLLRRERFDMMLSDVVMPGGMTGIELARICGREHPDMRIVLTSGYAGEDVDAALADAPWPFLRKPYSGEQLARILGELG